MPLLMLTWSHDARQDLYTWVNCMNAAEMGSRSILWDVKTTCQGLATFELLQFDHCNGQICINNHGKLKILWLHLNYNKINLGLNLLCKKIPYIKEKAHRSSGPMIPLSLCDTTSGETWFRWCVVTRKLRKVVQIYVSNLNLMQNPYLVFSVASLGIS